MKRHLLSVLRPAVVMMVGFGFSVSTLSATAQDGVVPFIKDQYWKQNISMESFQENPREYFRSETAFSLLVGYVESEIGQEITNAEFIALMRDDNQVRVRDCPVSETIQVGGLEGDHFYWFSRNCRAGEEIVQIRLDGRWIDVFSLSCLNAKEDTTPVPVPVLTVAPAVIESEPEPETGMNCQWVKVKEEVAPPIFASVQPAFTCDCFVPGTTVFVPGGTQTNSELDCDYN